MKMRYRCSKCGSVLVDLKKKICNCTLYTTYELEPAEVGMKFELVQTGKYIMCINCGHVIPLSKLKQVVGVEEWFNKIVRFIEDYEKGKVLRHEGRDIS